MSSNAATADQEVTVYEPHQGKLPPLRRYGRHVWERRRFAFELARTNLKAQHYDTFLGQVWQVLNPFLLAMVYYFAWGIIAGGAGKAQESGSAAGDSYLAFIVGGLFLFYFTRNAMGLGAGSIVGGGGLLMNSAFPRAILPLSSTISALLMYLPTFVVFLGFHLAFGGDLAWSMLLIPVLFAVLFIFNFGLAMAAAALTVYFRDTSSFLPYLLRIWLYLSPILWTLEQVPERFRAFLVLNPLVPYLTVWHRLVAGEAPETSMLVAAGVWTVVAPLAGGWFFLSREREFAVRV